MKIKHLLLATVTFGSALCGCQSSSDGPDSAFTEAERIALSESEFEIVEKQNDFAYRLFDVINEANRGNMVMSPLSISMNLSMLANATDGNTLAEILDVLGFEDGDMNEVNALNKRLLEALPSLDNTSSLSLSNALWHRSDIIPTDDFKAVCEQTYKATLFNTLENGYEVTKDINKWASNNTSGMIQSLAFPNPSMVNSRLVLLNALYFKAQWQNVKKIEVTVNSEFTNADGSKKSVPMFGLNLVGQAYETDSAEFAQVLYGNGAFILSVIKPHPGIDLTEIINESNSKKYIKHLMFGNSFDMTFRMPKTSLSSSINFYDYLQSMGIKDAFDIEKSDFSKAFPKTEIMSLYDISQSSEISFDEKGTTAASVTKSEVGNIGWTPPKPKREIVLDSPFLFFISEKSTGAILFMGKVTQL